MTTLKLIKIAFKTTPVSYWFTYWWWKYLFETPKGSWKKYCSNWHRFWCRAAGHPEGVWWYNPGGCEPDMSCKGCGDDLE